MKRRPLIIAGVLAALILALLTAETLREGLEVAPMPPEMECGVKRACSTPDVFGPPPTAPRSADIRPLEPAQRGDDGKRKRTRH